MPVTDDPKPTTERRFLLCTGERVLYKNLYKHPESHIIGEFKYAQILDLKVTVLERWDVSVSAGMLPPLHPALDCVCIGNVDRIKCHSPECPHVTYWDVSENALIAMVKELIRR